VGGGMRYPVVEQVVYRSSARAAKEISLGSTKLLHPRAAIPHFPKT